MRNSLLEHSVPAHRPPACRTPSRPACRTVQDFERIRKLKQRALVEAALTKHGLASATSRAKKARLLEAAEEEAAEALAMQQARQHIGEAKVAAGDLVGEYGSGGVGGDEGAWVRADRERGSLCARCCVVHELTMCPFVLSCDTGRHKARKDKAARLASVLEGREGREKFGARSGLKKKKTAGLSEREKQRKKAMPMAARLAQIRRRNAAARGRGKGKNFKGHKRS